MKVSLPMDIKIGISLIILSLIMVILFVISMVSYPYAKITIRDEDGDFEGGIVSIHPGFFFLPSSAFLTLVGFILVYFNKKIIYHRDFKYFTIIGLSFSIIIVIMISYFIFEIFVPVEYNELISISTFFIFICAQFIYCAYIFYFLFGISSSKIVERVTELYYK